MAKRTPNYAKMDREQLLAEVETRKNAGTDLGVKPDATDDEMRDVLQLDDEAKASDAREQTPQGQDHKAIATSDGMSSRAVPEDLDEYKGQYRYIATGEIFGLKVKDDSEVFAHKTHHAKNALKFWDGTAAEFRAAFDKV